MTLWKAFYLLALICFVAVAIMEAVAEDWFIGSVGLLACGLAFFTLPNLVKDRTL